MLYSHWSNSDLPVNEGGLIALAPKQSFTELPNGVSVESASDDVELQETV